MPLVLVFRGISITLAADGERSHKEKIEREKKGKRMRGMGLQLEEVARLYPYQKIPMLLGTIQLCYFIHQSGIETPKLDLHT